MHLTSLTPSTAPVTIACDAGAYKLNLVCRELSTPDTRAEWETPNRTEAITSTLLAIREKALRCGITELHVSH